MKIISFHLCGKMAHFRRYYSNSSSLSYSIPPRTTVVGILAGLLGWERDSYYEKFALDQCDIAVSLCSPIKKSMQKMNLLMVKSVNDLNASQDYHSQTATEFIIPADIRNGAVDYKIWVCHHNEDIMRQMEQLLSLDVPGYKSRGISIGLGSAFNLGWIEKFAVLEGEEFNESALQLLESSIVVSKLQNLDFQQMQNSSYRLVREELPLEFDSNRRLTNKGLGDFIVDLNGNPVPAVVKKYVQVEDGNSIMWMS